MSTQQTLERGMEAVLERMPELRPLDEHNSTLLSNVHPTDWENPKPSGRYNLVVIGAGTAGLVCAAGAAGMGAKVALIERRLMGGDCLNVGCVPSKALIRAGKAVADARAASDFGVQGAEHATVDFEQVMERMRRLRARISPHDSAARFRDLGIDVFIGEAAFRDDRSVRVGDATLEFSRAVIATGGRAIAPPIPGLEDAGYLTNESIFSLTQLPARLAVIGAGPIGSEMAQSFARFGSKVTVLEASDRVLPREDPEAGDLVGEALRRDGVDLWTRSKVSQVSSEDGERVLTVETEQGTRELHVDHVLVSAGRAPNVGGLGLEAADVLYDPKVGVTVDDRLRTSNRRIFAAGDVCSQYKFTHAADAMARIVIQNALFFGRAKASALAMPWCTYTDPEVAHVGLSRREAEERGIACDEVTVHMSEVDRAILDGEEDGYLTVLLKKGKDQILGATLVGRHAGETISVLSLAMVSGKGLGTIARTIHPYPTQAEIVKKAADAFNRGRLTPRVHGLFKRLMAWRR